MLLCPLCQEPLTPDEKNVACRQGHRFDRARQGYLNLLPVQHKKSRQPGDGKAMVQGRRAFLNAGYYQPIAEAVTQSLLSHLDGGSASLLDRLRKVGILREEAVARVDRLGPGHLHRLQDAVDP